MTQDKQNHEDVLILVSQYWDLRSEGYGIQVDREEQQEAFTQYKEWLSDISQGIRVLDVGCGPGFFATQLAAQGALVTAVDMSCAMLEKTQKRAQAKGVCVKTIQADAQNLPFADDSFDVVCCRNLVWNLPEPERAYREWLRVLVPGGRLVVFDGNHYRYLFDERYAHVQKDWEKMSGHVLLGVKTQAIDALAEELPMGRVDRPRWDVEELKRQGAQDVRQKILSVLNDPVDDRKLTKDFVVTCRKSVSR